MDSPFSDGLKTSKADSYWEYLQSFSLEKRYAIRCTGLDPDRNSMSNDDKEEWTWYWQQMRNRRKKGDNDAES